MYTCYQMVEWLLYLNIIDRYKGNIELVKLTILQVWKKISYEWDVGSCSLLKLHPEMVTCTINTSCVFICALQELSCRIMCQKLSPFCKGLWFIRVYTAVRKLHSERSRISTGETQCRSSLTERTPSNAGIQTAKNTDFCQKLHQHVRIV